VGFKEDAQFARYVTMGAVGTAAVARDLRTRFGHNPIELERYAMANKVWGVKMKRMRIPDLVCTDCGRRVESKAKTKLEVKLSHSGTPGREWNAGGMRDQDVFAFVRVSGSGESASTVGEPGYFTRGGLQRAVGHVRQGGRKAASEGSEVDLSWPVWVPSVDGTLVELENDEVIFTTADGKRKKYWQSRNWPERHLYLSEGEAFIGKSTIVAGVIESISDLTCTGASWDIGRDLAAQDADDRYAAVKAAGVSSTGAVVDPLVVIAEDGKEDWRIKLEAMASLARLDDAAMWVTPIAEVGSDTDRDVAEQMEAVFILSEIPASEAADALNAIGQAQTDRHEEVRAAAVWGLGTGAARAGELALAFTTDPNDRVALHAAAAIQELPSAAIKTLRTWLREGDARAASVAAALLAHHDQIEVLLDAAAEDGAARLWAMRALGDLSPAKVKERADGRLTREMLEALAPLWVQHEDWLRTAENEGALPLLAEQQVRFEPTNP